MVACMQVFFSRTLLQGEPACASTKNWIRRVARQTYKGSSCHCDLCLNVRQGVTERQIWLLG